MKGFDYVQCQTCGATINAIHKNEYIAAEKLWNDRADERPKGEWIDYKHGAITKKFEKICSMCGNLAAKNPFTLEAALTDFCPNCGSDMRKEKGNGSSLNVIYGEDRVRKVIK